MASNHPPAVASAQSIQRPRNGTTRRSREAAPRFIHARLNGPARHVRIGDPFLDDIYWIVGWLAGGVLALGIVLTVVRL